MPTGNEGEIAVVYAVGTIVPGKSQQEPVPVPFLGGRMLGSETLIAAMEEARQNERVKAVVLRINSPGGSAAASEAMWQAIRRTAEEKPVIVSMGDVAASGGYWISTAADTIVADPLTITGSIGVIGILFNAGGLFENKLGITYDLLRTSPYADMFSGLVPPEPYEVERLQQTILATYRTFLQKVSQARGLPVDSVDAIGGGRVWSGEAAHRIGLVDVLGGLDRAIAIAAEKSRAGAGHLSDSRAAASPDVCRAAGRAAGGKSRADLAQSDRLAGHPDAGGLPAHAGPAPAAARYAAGPHVARGVGALTCFATKSGATGCPVAPLSFRRSSLTGKCPAPDTTGPPC